MDICAEPVVCSDVFIGQLGVQRGVLVDAAHYTQDREGIMKRKDSEVQDIRLNTGTRN